LKSELGVREAKLRCLNYNFDDSAEGEFVETIFAAQNQLERKQNRRQVCQKMKARLERGYWCFGPPAGYKYKKDKEHGKLIIPIKPASNILAEGLNAFAENKLLNQTDFLDFLKSKNFHKHAGIERISLEYVKRILTQQLYAGIIELEKWGVTKRRGHHKAIISEETYEKIQIKLLRPERKPRATDSYEFPLRRIVSCAVCGKNMTSSVNKGKRKYYPHYTCNNTECGASPKNISPEKMESDYLEMLQSIKAEPEVLEIGKVIAAKIWEKKIKDADNNNEAKEAEREEIEKMIENYIDLIPNTKSNSIRVRYEAKIEELDKQLRVLKNTPETKKIPDIQEAFNLIFKFIGTPAETWKKADNKAKILIHNMIFTSNPVYSLATGFGTPELSLPFRINEHIDDDDNNLVDLSRKFWNTFFEIALEWEPTLRLIYDSQKDNP
jgi:hypothetical protein